MAAPNSPTLARVQVATAEAGAYNDVGYTRSFELVRGSEGDTTLRWLGGDASTAGEKTLEGTIPVWWDPVDTDGQEILKAAYEAGTPVWLRYCPQGTTTGSPYRLFEANITEVRESADPENDGIEGSFSYRGAPSTYDEGTLA